LTQARIELLMNVTCRQSGH